MSDTLRFEVPTALQYFASLVAEDEGFALLEAAIAVAQDEYPRLDPQGVLAQVDALADRLKRRIPADAVVLQKLRFLNRYFFQDLGFAGNVNNYYDPRNSYLHEVLAMRRGIPITLALLYIELATQIGLSARGVSFPGHFLVKLRAGKGEVVIDPLTGQSLSRAELEERLLPYRRSRGLTGDFEVPLGLFLQAAPPRDVIARLLRNLKEIHRTRRGLAASAGGVRAAGGAAAAGLGGAARPRPGAGRTGSGRSRRAGPAGLPEAPAAGRRCASAARAPARPGRWPTRPACIDAAVGAAGRRHGSAP